MSLPKADPKNRSIPQAGSFRLCRRLRLPTCSLPRLRVEANSCLTLRATASVSASVDLSRYAENLASVWLGAAENIMSVSTISLAMVPWSALRAKAVSSLAAGSSFVDHRFRAGHFLTPFVKQRQHLFGNEDQVALHPPNRNGRHDGLIALYPMLKVSNREEDALGLGSTSRSAPRGSNWKVPAPAARVAIWRVSGPALRRSPLHRTPRRLTTQAPSRG